MIYALVTIIHFNGSIPEMTVVKLYPNVALCNIARVASSERVAMGIERANDHVVKSVDIACAPATPGE